MSSTCSHVSGLTIADMTSDGRESLSTKEGLFSGLTHVDSGMKFDKA